MSSAPLKKVQESSTLAPVDPLPTKKPYVIPQLFRVELSQEQAILSACSLAANTGSNGGGGNCRPTTNCKRANGAGGADAGARAS